MRIGNIEGTPEEIRDLCENHGLRIQDYLDAPEKKDFHYGYVVAAGLAFVFMLVIAALLPEDLPTWRPLLTTIGLAVVVWTAACVHLRFRATWVSALVGLGLAAVWLVAIKAISPEAAVEFVNKRAS